MNWINRLFTEINELIVVMAAKLNSLDTAKEDKSNKKQDLTSTSADDYPSVPAVNDGLDATLQTAQTYTDLKIGQNNANYIPVSQKGANNGVATLDNTGKVPSTQLPSYVDDVVDLVNIVTSNPSSGMTAGNKYYNSTTKKIFTATNATTGVSSDPESDKIYVNISNNTTWRWSGTALVQMNAGLTLGTTSSTAYRGDRGLIAYNHSQETGNPHGTLIADIPQLAGILAAKSDVSHQHALATTINAGFVRLGSDVLQTGAPVTPTATSNRTYAVQLDANGRMLVNVPWGDTTYTSGNLAHLNASVPDTTSRLWSPNVLNGWGDGKYVQLSEMGDPTVGIPDWSGALQTQTPNI